MVRRKRWLPRIFLYASKNSQRKDAANIIKMTTQIPPRYVFLSASSKGLMLLLLIFSLLYGLFAIIYYISSNLFLQKYINPSSPSTQWKGIAALIHPYKSVPNIDQAMEKRLANLPNEYKKYPPNLEEEQTIAGEKKIITTAKELKIFYDSVWKACTDEQKYLLSNFSKSGLMNFRSTADIYSLLDRGVLIQEKEEFNCLAKVSGLIFYWYCHRNKWKIWQKKWKETVPGSLSENPSC